uniref:Uncharacterized protein n=1 Tax=Romanomermis culicivorax TaxID=13658 RepID=A0A915IW84_ROMCU
MLVRRDSSSWGYLNIELARDGPHDVEIIPNPRSYACIPPREYFHILRHRNDYRAVVGVTRRAYRWSKFHYFDPLTQVTLEQSCVYNLQQILLLCCAFFVFYRIYCQIFKIARLVDRYRPNNTDQFDSMLDSIRRNIMINKELANTREIYCKNIEE